MCRLNTRIGIFAIGSALLPLVLHAQEPLFPPAGWHDGLAAMVTPILAKVPNRQVDFERELGPPTRRFAEDRPDGTTMVTFYHTRLIARFIEGELVNLSVTDPTFTRDSPLRIGMSQNELVALLGEPGHSDVGGEWYWQDDAVMVFALRGRGSRIEMLDISLRYDPRRDGRRSD